MHWVRSWEALSKVLDAVELNCLVRARISGSSHHRGAVADGSGTGTADWAQAFAEAELGIKDSHRIGQ